MMSVLLVLVLLSLSAGMAVHKRHAYRKLEGEELTDRFALAVPRDLTLKSDLNNTENLGSRLPVYTINVDDNGKYVYRLESLTKEEVRGEEILRKIPDMIETSGEEPSNRVKRDGFPGYPQEFGELDNSYVANNADVRTMLKLHCPPAGQGIDVHIDIVVVADSVVYTRFKNRYKNKAASLSAMKDYYRSIINNVNSIYQKFQSCRYAIRVGIVKLFVAETAAASKFTVSREHAPGHMSDISLAETKKIIKSFVAFVRDNNAEIFKQYDHVMLFTGKDLAEGTNPDDMGIARRGSMCNGDQESVTVIEDMEGVTASVDIDQVVIIAAHELGHSFNASHDGTRNNCRSNEGHLMSPQTEKILKNKKFKTNPFSSCSIQSITDFIDSFMEDPKKRECLKQKLLHSESRRAVDAGEAV